MRVLITGANGFVGRQLCGPLIEAGHHVVAVLRSPVGMPADLGELSYRVVGDLVHGVSWDPIVQGVDAVVHLAAIAHRRMESLSDLSRINVDVTRAIGEAVSRAGGRLIYVSSVKVHGEESGEWPIREGDALNPDDAYATSKAQAETALGQLASRSSLRLTLLRPPLIYGPEVKANFLSLMRLIKHRWPLPLASVHNLRSMIYVGNLVDAIACCLESPAAAGRTYLVADGAPVSTPQLCRALGAALGRPARLFPFPPAVLDWIARLRRLTRSLEIDDSAIRAELGWHPPYTFEQGLRATAEWYLSQGR